MKKGIIIGALVVVLAAGVVGGFYFLMNRDTEVETSVEVTEVQELISMDIAGNYPASPRAVVNLYSRFLTALYNEEYSDDNFSELITQMRELMDEELLEQNPEDTYYSSMYEDVQNYKTQKWTISNYTIPDADEVTYKTIDGYEFALLTASYFIKENTSYAKTYQNYVLRQDASDNWKIYGYSVQETEDTGESDE